MLKTPRFLKNRYKNDIETTDFITVRKFKNGTVIKDLIDENSKFTVIR
jgi:hypothetical protein